MISIQKSVKYIIFTFVISMTTMVYLNAATKSEKQDKETQEIVATYKQLFGKHKIPNTFIELAKFEKHHGSETYARSFYLKKESEDFTSWLDSDKRGKKKLKEYSDRLITFAGADGTGGFYALWLQKGNSDLEKAPIIFFGSEGAIEVVALNLKELIKLLSFGAEGLDGHFNHSIDEYDEDSEFENFESEFTNNYPSFLAFRVWMKELLDIEPIREWAVEESDEVNSIVDNARKKVKKEFDVWQYQFYPNPEEEDKKYRAQKLSEIIQKEKALLDTLQMNPNSIDLYLSLALLEDEKDIEMGYRRDKVIEYYEKVLELNPNHLDTLKKLAYMEQSAAPKKTLSLYNRILEIEPIQPELYDDIADAYQALGEVDKAIEFYTKSIIENPRSNGGYSQKDLVKVCNIAHIDPIPILEKTLKKAEHYETYKMLEQLEFKAKNYEQAYKHYQKYSSIHELQNFEYIDYGKKYYRKEAYPIALLIFSEALKKQSDKIEQGEFYNWLGVISTKMDDNKNARVYFKKACELDPDEPLYKKNYTIVNH